MLWTYIVMALDICLYKQHSKITDLEADMEKFVEERVMAFESKLRNVITEKKALISILEKKITELESRVESQSLYLEEVQKQMHIQGLEMASIRDPEGCTALRLVL